MKYSQVDTGRLPKEERENGYVLGDAAVKRLLQQQEFRDKQLILSAEAGNVAYVRHFLGMGANPNSDVYVVAVNGVNALGGAAIAHNINIMNILLEQGADVNAKDSLGRISMEVAALENFEEGFNLMLSKGANLAAQSPRAVVIKQVRGDFILCKDKESRSNQWSMKTAKGIRPATIFDIVLSAGCNFSQNTKDTVRALRDIAVKEGILTLMEGEVISSTDVATKFEIKPQRITPHTKKMQNDDTQNTKA